LTSFHLQDSYQHQYRHSDMNDLEPN
jgi:hypothetical protein